MKPDIWLEDNRGGFVNLLYTTAISVIAVDGDKKGLYVLLPSGPTCVATGTQQDMEAMQASIRARIDALLEDAEVTILALLINHELYERRQQNNADSRLNLGDYIPDL